MRKSMNQVPKAGIVSMRQFVSSLGIQSEYLAWCIQRWGRDALDAICCGGGRGHEALRTALSARMAMTVQDRSGAPLRVGRNLVLGSKKRQDGNIQVNVLGGFLVMSEEEAKSFNIPIGHPILLSRRDELKLAVMVRAAEWGEEHGFLEKGWSSDPDLHIELGLTHRPAHMGKEVRKLSDLVQYRDRDMDQTQALIRRHWQERERTDRFIEVPQTRLVTRVTEPRMVTRIDDDGKTVTKWVLGGGIEITGEEFYGVDRRATGRDEADVDSEEALGAFRDHDGYNGVKPLHAQSRKDYALSKRPRYRMDTGDLELAEYVDSSYKRLQKAKPYVYDEKGRIKESCKKDGHIAPEHLDVWRLRAKFRPESTWIKYWEKRFAPSYYLQVVEKHLITDPKEIVRLRQDPRPYVGLAKTKNGWVADRPVVTDHREVDAILRDPQKRKLVKLAWKGGLLSPVMKVLKKDQKPEHTGEWRMSPPEGLGTYTAECFGMLRGVIEADEYDHVALVPTKDFTKQVSRFVETPDGRKAVMEEARELSDVCFRCARKGDSGPKRWVMKPHAWICTSCGSERARVYALVYVPVEFLGMLQVKERVQRVTHVAVKVYGQWVRDLIDCGHRPDGVARRPKHPRVWTPSSQHPPMLNKVPTQWVEDLLELDITERNQEFWKQFRENVEKRYEQTQVSEAVTA